MEKTNRPKSQKTMKTEKEKQLLIEQLKKTPIVQIACERVGVGRATYYRWRKEDEEFKKTTDEAIIEGETLITDMSESQLISLIRDKNFPAIQLWLRSHHPKYTSKVEVTGNLNVKEEPLTLEQEELVEKALQLAGLLKNKQTQQNHE
jgi:predicted DNA-binding transcriptional regulator AlpA